MKVIKYLIDTVGPLIRHFLLRPKVRLKIVSE